MTEYIDLVLREPGPALVLLMVLVAALCVACVFWQGLRAWEREHLQARNLDRLATDFRAVEREKRRALNRRAG